MVTGNNHWYCSEYRGRTLRKRQNLSSNSRKFAALCRQQGCGRFTSGYLV
jgi:hypothetical protein